MQGLWLENNNLSLRKNLPVPTPSEQETLIKVLQVGICNTDLELVRGYYPYCGTPGHEFVGICQEGPQHLKGKIVVGEINASCHKCEYCLNGLKNHCSNRTVLGIVNRNGAFAEYLTLPAENLYAVPESISIDEATFVEPLAAALQIQEQIAITERKKVLVVGIGKLGYLVAQTLKLTDCQLSLLVRNPSQAEKLCEQGFDAFTAKDLKQVSYDVAVEVTGNPDGFAIALSSLKPRGQMVLKSTYADRLTLDMAPIVVNEISLLGSRCGPFAKAIALLEKRMIDVTPLIQEKFPMEKSLAAFTKAQQSGSKKIIVEVARV